MIVTCFCNFIYFAIAFLWDDNLFLFMFAMQMWR